jgi:signal transduction histidine kinase
MKFWQNISNLGDKSIKSSTQKKTLLLFNRILFFISLSALIGYSATFVTGVIIFRTGIGYGFLRLVLIFILGIICLLLNWKNYILHSKVLVSFALPFLLIVFPTIMGDVKIEYYFYYPFAGIAISLLPVLIFTQRNEKWLLISLAFYCFLISVTSDNMLTLFSKVKPLWISELEERYAFYKISQFILFGFVFSVVYNLKQLNIMFEADLEEKNIELKQSNEEQLTINEELLAQREELENTLDKLKETQKRLIQSEKMASLGVLTAGIAHEINNPVNFINTSLQILKNTFDNETTNKQLESVENTNISSQKKNFPLVLSNMQTGVDRIVEIIKGLGIYARADDEKKSLADIHEILDSSLILLTNKYKNKISIIKDYGNLPKIPCNMVKLSQVFINILSNAVDSILDKDTNDIEGFIEISTHTNEKYIQIKIKDNGVGIPEQIASRIFEPFYTTKPVGKGVGLGLYITHSIIENHQGQINFKNLPEGGTEFIIELPKK